MPSTVGTAIARPEPQNRTSIGLRDILFEEIASLRSGEGTVQRAAAVAKLAAGIIAAARLDFDYSRYAVDGTPLELRTLQLGTGQ